MNIVIITTKFCWHLYWRFYDSTVSPLSLLPDSMSRSSLRWGEEVRITSEEIVIARKNTSSSSRSGGNSSPDGRQCILYFWYFWFLILLIFVNSCSVCGCNLFLQQQCTKASTSSPVAMILKNNFAPTIDWEKSCGLGFLNFDINTVDKYKMFGKQAVVSMIDSRLQYNELK